MKHPLVLSSEISPDKVGSMGFLLLLQETSAFAFVAWRLHSIVELKFRYADMCDLMTCQPLRPQNPWYSSPHLATNERFFLWHMIFFCVCWMLLILFLLLERSLPWFFFILIGPFCFIHLFPLYIYGILCCSWYCSLFPF